MTYSSPGYDNRYDTRPYRDHLSLLDFLVAIVVLPALAFAGVAVVSLALGRDAAASAVLAGAITAGVVLIRGVLAAFEELLAMAFGIVVFVGVAALTLFALHLVGIGPGLPAGLTDAIGQPHRLLAP